ncbi:MAG: DnaJ domain-containing protein [Cyclobacteriaceae bacterium]
MKRYYNILGISEDADKDSIRQAYRKLALAYHPDRNPSPDADQHFIAVKEAYDILIGREGNTADLEIYEFKQAFQEWQREEMEARLRREERRKRARDAARLQYETFLKNNQHFRDSWYFYPAMLLAYSILYINRLVSVILFLGPLASLVFFSTTWPFLVPATAVCWIFAFRLLSLATVYREEINPYFSAHHQPAFRT